MLKKALFRCGGDVLYIVPNGEDTPLKQSVVIANKEKADLDVSVHYDAYDGKFDGYDPEGFTAYINSGSKEGRRLAGCVLKQLADVEDAPPF